MLRIFRQYYPIRNIFFVLGEFFVIYASGLIANWFIHELSLFHSWGQHIRILLITFVCQTCLYYNDLYDLKVTDSFSELSVRLLQSLGAAAIILGGIYTVYPRISMGLEVFMVSIVFDILFIVSWRFLYTIILNLRIFDQKIIVMGSGELPRNIFHEIKERKDCGYVVAGVILEGRDREDEKIRQMFTDKVELIGYIDEPGLCKRVKALEIKKIIVGLFERREDRFPTQELLKCRVDGIEILDGNSFYEMLTGKLTVDHIQPEWLIFSEGFRKSGTDLFLKRVTDIVLSFLLLAGLLPVIGLTALLIKLDKKEPEMTPADKWRYFSKLCLEEQIQDIERDAAEQNWDRETIDKEKKRAEKNALSRRLRQLLRASGPEHRNSSGDMMATWRQLRAECAETGESTTDRLMVLVTDFIAEREPQNVHRPVFFSQKRMGKDGREYDIYKFRSMIVNAERISGPMWAGENDKRVTRLGWFIRKWRIDEIPQLWNILKGEMSFVGPRPEREHFVKQLELAIPYYRERLTVKPGLTGWAQVCYGYGASEDDAKEKLNYDLFYIKNMSIAMDLMIVMRTVKIVLFGKGR